MKPLVLRFLAIVGLAFFAASCTDARRCQLAAAGCLCAVGSCERGARCVTGMCEACPLGTEDCPCDSGTCDSGLACVTSEDLCVAEDRTVCENSCFADWHDDGFCDDGGPDSSYSSCNLGSDCTDCGARRNPCVDPQYPRFCPETPDFPSQCWTEPTDCDSILFCGDDPTPHACIEGYRYDCVMETCVESVCTNPEFPVFCDYDPSCATSGLCCFRTNADCRTVTMCHGGWYACRSRTTSSALVPECGATVHDVDCVLPTPP